MNLTELAKDPQAFDTELARLHAELAKAQGYLADKMAAVLRAAGAHRRSTRFGITWDMSYDVAAGKVLDTHPLLVGDVHISQRVWREIENQIQDMDRAYTGWTRFFPSVTKSQPHIHRSLHCHTLHATTIMTWAPGLSGKSDDEAVFELDEALCSKCFPDAPVALHNYQSKRTQAERDARQVEKDARDAKRAAKTLTEAEQFKTQGRYGERVTTVAKLKELVRKAVELAVEVEYWTQAAAGTRSVPNWSYEQIARRLGNLRDDAADAATDANRAKLVLMTREAEHQGWGATQAEITKMQQSKDRSARKEWGL